MASDVTGYLHRTDYIYVNRSFFTDYETWIRTQNHLVEIFSTNCRTERASSEEKGARSFVWLDHVTPLMSAVQETKKNRTCNKAPKSKDHARRHIC